jgi:modification methylase
LELETTHSIHFKNSEDLGEIESGSVDLMITSPPYPMIEMWDDVFSIQNPLIKDALSGKRGDLAYELMHKELEKVWKQVYRVLKKGAFACINIGDATRKVDDEFQLYPNYSRILNCCMDLGFSPLPEILWKKQTNAPNKFLGSGMLPGGAYVTLEHEFILILRKGSKRESKTEDEKLKRLQSAFFWEERNTWFSDIWDHLKGIKQNNIDSKIRERSGAFPFELPYRLINMFSLKGEKVLDPFLGTGTTMAAAMATERESIGFEIDTNFKELYKERFKDIVVFSNDTIQNRLNNHRIFIENERQKKKRTFRHNNKKYGFSVVTKQETEIKFDLLTNITDQGNGKFKVTYSDS